MLCKEGEPADTDNLLTMEKLVNNLREENEYISDLEHVKRVVEEVHTDLGYYQKSITAMAFKNRYSMSPQLLNEALKVLYSCKPFQLYKPALAP